MFKDALRVSKYIILTLLKKIKKKKKSFFWPQKSIWGLFQAQISHIFGFFQAQKDVLGAISASF